MYDLVVIGGGAAGFFGALQTAQLAPDSTILILEKTTKLLSKVRISGGGRCNVTHHCLQPTPLSKHYPRGQAFLKQSFRTFAVAETIDWFQQRNVLLKTEEDGRMFPVTDSSETIVDCFLREARIHRIEIQTSQEVTALIHPNHVMAAVQTGRANPAHVSARAVLVATGGHPQAEAYQFLAHTGHTLRPPIPSLFTFNDPSRKFSDLMGISVAHGSVKIVGTDFESSGPILVTHWGLSGPAVIRLSAWAAEVLFQKKYQFSVLVNWTGLSEEETRQRLLNRKEVAPARKLAGDNPLHLPQRLWQALMYEAGLADSLRWGECGTRQLNKLVEVLVRTPFAIRGKTTFKEEFVTCGGVPLDEIDRSTMESKKVKGLFFAGEVLHIDGETGGFNFQAAWTTAAMAARAISQRMAAKS